uniref:Uncharacterized protein n=1 Tax=Anguilla anguilla TaxID=7936 RepID=A0A0E9SH78_ANGAN
MQQLWEHHWLPHGERECTTHTK